MRLHDIRRRLCNNDKVRFILGAWLLLLTAASIAPNTKIALHNLVRWHDTLHLVVFLVTGVIALLPADAGRTRGFRAAALTIYCAVTELIQARVYHNGFEWADLFFDSLGLCFAWLIVLLYRRVMMAEA